MSGRSKPYKPKAFESAGNSNDTSANIYESMMLHPAFMTLTKNQRLLYVYMKKQYYGHRKPAKDNADIEALQGDDKFYFNFHLAQKYNLYKRGNESSFYGDIRAIEAHGFIRTVANGKDNHQRSIYEFSGDWRSWTPEQEKPL